MDFVRSHFGKMNLWPVEHLSPHFGVPVVLPVPQSEEKNVQLVRGLSFRSDFLHNPYFSIVSLRRTVWQPYRLSQIDVLCINLSNQPKDQSLKFSPKKIENWGSWKSQFFWVGHLDFFFFLSHFFCYITMKISWWLPWFTAKE